MSGWEHLTRSREPSPEEIASQKEAERLGRGTAEAEPTAEDDGETERRRAELQKILQLLLKRDRGLYIVLIEFLRVGDFSFNRGEPSIRAPWGFYSKYAKRWQCSEAAVRSWVKQALRLLARVGKDRET